MKRKHIKLLKKNRASMLDLLCYPYDKVMYSLHHFPEGAPAGYVDAVNALKKEFTVSFIGDHDDQVVSFHAPRYKYTGIYRSSDDDIQNAVFSTPLKNFKELVR